MSHEPEQLYDAPVERNVPSVDSGYIDVEPTACALADAWSCEPWCRARAGQATTPYGHALRPASLVDRAEFFTHYLACWTETDPGSRRDLTTASADQHLADVRELVEERDRARDAAIALEGELAHIREQLTWMNHTINWAADELDRTERRITGLIAPPYVHDTSREDTDG